VLASLQDAEGPAACSGGVGDCVTSTTGYKLQPRRGCAVSKRSIPQHESDAMAPLQGANMTGRNRWYQPPRAASTTGYVMGPLRGHAHPERLRNPRTRPAFMVERGAKACFCSTMAPLQGANMTGRNRGYQPPRAASTTGYVMGPLRGQAHPEHLRNPRTRPAFMVGRGAKAYFRSSLCSNSGPQASARYPAPSHDRTTKPPIALRAGCFQRGTSMVTTPSRRHIRPSSCASASAWQRAPRGQHLGEVQPVAGG